MKDAYKLPVANTGKFYNPFKDAAIQPAFQKGDSQVGYMDWLHSLITGIPLATGNPAPPGTPGSGVKMEKGKPVDAYNQNTQITFPFKDVVVYGIAILFVYIGVSAMLRVPQSIVSGALGGIRESARLKARRAARKVTD